ncbi:MAG: diaminopimelate decarboxylase [Bacteroidaceae bacterium]|jgi:diaminopimelate decarboxylase|uniref:diaminopimelate decarboxylase n=1 Tax=unclassified Bacteroides TaxID=2646097 RepID=UPI0004E0F25E|nr:MULTISPECIES: diaminopimelate decarboxylase [unclassified Bacteroides]MBP5221479.1 diaminopimelate decarboxylase [Bacteroidaceae bacterium]MBQ1677592.1 diaminopimelate decarboxylase [Bacteroidaceae bacterium]MBQ2056924.1 diaminopimelate decarboxylase [Bacteroidaceae bacterium]MBQ3874282.1 diaminopimelate decarboxylase [Bacteroidaceae bacterium]MBQ5477601.1 diaminopimelate decarboxylase [Bacteroidaceae bacterium]
MKGHFPVEKFANVQTPFYYYDTKVLRETLDTIKKEIGKYENYSLHYAVKANANGKVLSIINQFGFGADCVSGGEIKAALNAGFPADKIVYAGVGKSDWEINLGLEKGIFCFNVESIPELEIINELAEKQGKVARVAFRINPNVGAHTHANITTGLAENKFGIAMEDMEKVIEIAKGMKNIQWIGLHFHIGSQILDMSDFVALCNRINELQTRLEHNGITVEHINVGGGLGIDYENPNKAPIPTFAEYFECYHKHLNLRSNQHLHFELGRAVVGQCGSLITKTLYVKQGSVKQFCIVDAGMTDLIRPALYQAYHKIENISSDEPNETYDVVGPICESSDVFAKAIDINKAHRGDLIALRSAGAYGEIMASGYNCRALPKGYITEDFI